MSKEYVGALIEKIRTSEWQFYKKARRNALKNRNFSIITSNCVGTIMYHDLKLQFLSPTINLTIGMNDFVKFAEDLKSYTKEEIVELKGDYECPTGMLGDIKINFVHYKNFQEGVLKWEERKKRINWDNLFFIGTERGDCTYETLQRFDKLPYQNKVILTHVRYPEISSSRYIRGFEKEKQVGAILDFKKQFLKRRYLDDFDYVKFFNSPIREP